MGGSWPNRPHTPTPLISHLGARQKPLLYTKNNRRRKQQLGISFRSLLLRYFCHKQSLSSLGPDRNIAAVVAPKLSPPELKHVVLSYSPWRGDDKKIRVATRGQHLRR